MLRRHTADRCGFTMRCLLVADDDGYHLVALLDCIDHFLPIVEYLPKHGMLAIKPWCGDMSNEELRSVGVRSGIGHGEHTGTTVSQIGVEFVFKHVAGPAGSGTLGAAPLDHEILNHAVEQERIVKTFVCQFFKIGHGVGGFVVKQFDANATFVGGDRGYFHRREPFKTCWKR